MIVKRTGGTFFFLACIQLSPFASNCYQSFNGICLDKNIDLVCVPPHTSHPLQPLDVGLFSPLKRALSAEIEKLFRLGTRRILRIERTEAYITARAKAFASRSIESSFRASGIYPISPITILSILRTPTSTPPTTPLPTTISKDLDRSLLDSPPPEGNLRSYGRRYR